MGGHRLRIQTQLRQERLRRGEHDRRRSAGYQRDVSCDKERVSDAGTRHTDWIDDVLARASEPDRYPLSTPGSCPGDRSRP